MIFVFDTFNLPGVGVYLSLYKTRTNKALFCLFASRSRRSVILLISYYSYVLSQMQILVSAEL